MSGGITVIVDNVKQVRQEWVDNLKGIAVMAVVAIHSGGDFLQYWEKSLELVRVVFSFF